MTLRPGLRPATITVHAGASVDPATASPMTPIHRTSAFRFESVDEMVETFAGRRKRYIYSRYDNPTLEAAEARVAALEGTEGSVAFASGMSAIAAAVLAVAGAGDSIVAQRDLYGGTTRLFERTLARLGVETVFAATEEIEDLDRFLTPRTRAVWLESPTNPTLKVVDIAAVAARAAAAGVPLFVDNTFATPLNQTPCALGAAASVHSATKYLAGHGDLVAGVVAGSGEILARVRELRIDLGGVLDPEAGWLLARSLRTLALRVRAQNENAARIAGFLAAHPKVAAVNYPGLPSHPRHGTARRQMRGFGGMLSFEPAGGAAAARRFVEGLDLVALLPTLGGLETSVSIPAFSSHVSLTPEQRRLAGVGEGLVRLSVGIEDADDLVEELSTALERV